MDVIDDIVGTMRASGAAGGRVFRRSGAWDLRFAAVRGAGFHLVRQGTAWLTTARCRPTLLRAGDIVFSPYGAEHHLSDVPRPGGPRQTLPDETPARSASADIELVCAGYLLNRGRVHPYLRSLPDVVVMSSGDHRHPSLRSLADLMSDGVHESRRAAGVAVPALVDLLLVQGIGWAREHLGSSEEAAVSDAAIAAVLRAVHIDLGAAWTVDRLGAVAAMPRGAFIQRFRELVGDPPMTYVTNTRLSRAAGLLRTTRDPLGVIGRQVGYANEFAFATAFRRRFGIAPGRYRQSSRDAGTTSRIAAGPNGDE